MGALHQVFRVRGHVVAQVVKAELIVCSKRDVGHVSPPARLAVGLVLVDAIHAQSVEHIKRPHPLGVTLGQIVVHRDHMHAIARQGIQEHRKGGHQGLAFTRGHFGNLALMQHDAAEELHVVMDHVPDGVVPSCHPMVMIVRRVALYVHEIMLGRQFAVEIIGRDAHLLMGGKPLGRGLHDGKHHRHHLVQGFLVTLQHLFLQLVDLGEERGTVFNRRFFHFGFHLCDLGLDVVGRRLHVLSHFLRLGPQFVVAQSLDGRISLLHFLHQRLNQFHVAGGLVAEELTQKLVDIHMFVLF